LESDWKPTRTGSVAARRAAATRAARRERAATRDEVADSSEVETREGVRGFGSKFPWLTLEADSKGVVSMVDSRPFGIGKHGPHEIGTASVLAIDPGGTTGWCFIERAEICASHYDFDGVEGKLDGLSQVELDKYKVYTSADESEYDVIADQIPCHEAAEDENDLEAMLPGEIACAERIVKMLKLFWKKDLARKNGGCGVALVTEDFIPRVFNASRSFLSPVRINTLIASVLLREGLPPLLLQSPSTAKTTISDDYLKSVGLHNVGGRHANDATRHALVYLRRVDNNGGLHMPFLDRAINIEMTAQREKREAAEELRVSALINNNGYEGD